MRSGGSPRAKQESHFLLRKHLIRTVERKTQGGGRNTGLEKQGRNNPEKCTAEVNSGSHAPYTRGMWSGLRSGGGMRGRGKGGSGVNEGGIQIGRCTTENQLTHGGRKQVLGGGIRGGGSREY